MNEEAVEELKLLVLLLAKAPVSLKVEAPPLKWKLSL